MTTEELRKNYLKRERKRKARKFAILAVPGGLVLLIIIFLIISAIPSGNCFDNKQNRQEEGIDCGGACISCEVKNAKPLQVISTDILSETSEFKGVLAKIKNNNSNRGAIFDYKIILKDSLGQELAFFNNRSFIYPSSVKYIVQSKIPSFESEIAKVEIEFSEEEWFSSDINPTRLFSIAEAGVEKIEDASQAGYLKATSRLINQSTSPFKSIDLVIILYSKTSEVLSAVQTQVFDLESTEIRNFQYTWLNYFPDLERVDLNRVEIYPDALVD